MKTNFEAYDLWEIVDIGDALYDDFEYRVIMKENKKKDAKAPCHIQQGMDQPIFTKIMGA